MGGVRSVLSTKTHDIGGNLETAEVIRQEAVQEPETRGARLRYLDEERLGTALG